MAARGRFITLEGVDGAGKSTQLEFVAGLLEACGVDVVRTREPGGTPLGEALRRVLLERADLAMGVAAETLLVFAARAQHVEEIIEPALQRGQWVVCDRFTDATYAYQGGGRGLARARIDTLQRWVQGALRPDLTLLLDLPVVAGLARTGARADADRFESQDLEFKRAVRETYLARARRSPERIRRIDAEPPLPTVQEQIRREIESFLRRVAHDR